MRVFFALLLLAALGLGVIYPWAAKKIAGDEIGRWQVYTPAGGFRTIEVALDEAKAPVVVTIELKTVGPLAASAGHAVLTLTAAREGRTVLASPLNISGQPASIASPQSPQATYRETAGEIPEIDTGRYLFTIARGDAEAENILSIDLILASRAVPVDPRVQPVAYILMAVGFIGFVLALSRGRAPRNPNSMPPPPRWGRGGG